MNTVPLKEDGYLCVCIHISTTSKTVCPHSYTWLCLEEHHHVCRKVPPPTPSLSTLRISRHITKKWRGWRGVAGAAHRAGADLDARDRGRLEVCEDEVRVQLPGLSLGGRRPGALAGSGESNSAQARATWCSNMCSREKIRKRMDK